MKMIRDKRLRGKFKETIGPLGYSYHCRECRAQWHLLAPPSDDTVVRLLLGHFADNHSPKEIAAARYLVALRAPGNESFRQYLSKNDFTATATGSTTPKRAFAARLEREAAKTAAAAFEAKNRGWTAKVVPAPEYG